jgi:EAL domain-containing protein (putative c-di-GMP-specific phosphodiesterase class I)
MISLARKLSVRGRSRILIAVSAAITAVVVATVAVVAANGADGLQQAAAARRAHLAVDLLAAVGADMPHLTADSVRRGLSVTERAELNRAVERGQRLDILSNLTIWNRDAARVYANDPTHDNQNDERGQVEQALHGAPALWFDTRGLDLTTDRYTGTLDSFDPLADPGGRVFAVIETSLPMKPLLAQTAGVRHRILTFAIIAGLLLWLALLPVIARAARAAAKAWMPERHGLQRAFRHGLAQGEIELVYQPQMDPAHGGLRAVEGLIRWRRHGQLEGPGSFLPLIEGTPLMVDLTGRVIDLAIGQLAEWRCAGLRLRMSINLSADNLGDDTVVSQISNALERYDVPGDQLTVEVTETAILDDPICARRVLEAITELGVDVALDDFGTGNASISRLHQLPIRELKIDRSFVNLADGRNRAYLSAMVRFGQTLGLRVVAEGVEDAATLVYLRRLGCDLVQGYHIAKPLPADEIPRWRGRGALLTNVAASVDHLAAAA